MRYAWIGLMLLVVGSAIAAFVPLVDCPLAPLEARCVPGYLSVKPHGCSAGKKVSWLRRFQIRTAGLEAWCDHRGICPACRGQWANRVVVFSDWPNCADCWDSGILALDSLLGLGR